MRDSTRARGGASGDSGFTLIEITLSLSTLLVAVVMVALSLQTGFRVAREIRERELVHTQAQAYVDTILRQPFGAAADPMPSSGDVDELFDNDLDAGPVTLMQLRRQPSWTFTLAQFTVPGEWRIEVNEDLDEDGVVSGSLETGLGALIVRVYFDDELILSTVKSNDV
jgi:hypothetical protein